MALEYRILCTGAVGTRERKALPLGRLAWSPGTKQDAMNAETGDICLWVSGIKKSGESPNISMQYMTLDRSSVKGDSYLEFSNSLIIDIFQRIFLCTVSMN